MSVSEHRPAEVYLGQHRRVGRAELARTQAPQILEHDGTEPPAGGQVRVR